MAEYFTFVNVTKKLEINPLTYGSGLKFLEHCQVGDRSLFVILLLLKDEWKGDVLYHLGEYEDDCPETQSLIRTEYTGGILDPIEIKKGWSEIHDQKIKIELPLWEEIIKKYILVNYDLNVYCDIGTVPIKSDEFQLCPLSVLLRSRVIHSNGDMERIENKHCWGYTRVGLELKDSPVLDNMEKLDNT